MKGGFLLNIVIREGSAIFQLLAGENEPLLIRGDTFLVVYLGFDVVDGIRTLELQGNGLAGEG